MNFFAKLNAAIAHNQSLLCVGIEPNPEVLDLNCTVSALRRKLEFVITETSPFVCAYKPTLGFYTALGAMGFELLEHVLAIIPADIPVILDAKHCDLSTSTVMAKTVFE